MPFPILAALAVGQTLYGLMKSKSATDEFNAANKERKPYQTPDELYKILQATQSNAQSGYDPQTLSYLTNQTDRAFQSSLGTLQRMGGDPNSASALFDQQMQQIMKIGGQDHALRLENFSKYLGALDTIANSKSAEWSSKQDIVKDRLQSSNYNKLMAFKNIESGINTGIAAFSQSQMNNLYNDGTAGGTASAIDGTTKTPSQLEWERIMTNYRGSTGRSAWDSSAALPYNDFRLPR